jgi:hypothetical protein
MNVFYTVGKRDALVAVEHYTTTSGLSVVSAEKERLTETAFRQMLAQEFPGTAFNVREEKHIWVAMGIKER